MSDIDVSPDVEVEEMKEKIKKQKKEAKRMEKMVNKKKKLPEFEVEEDIEDIAHEMEEEANEIEEVNNGVEEIEEVEIVDEVVASDEDDAEMKALFDIQDSSELSDKLANAPIPDLTKSMGINEKIFTINELFGGNQSEMDNMLVALNGLESFEEAKSILKNSVASKYNWSDTHKSKKAKNFIKLVKRRYIQN